MGNFTASPRRFVLGMAFVAALALVAGACGDDAPPTPEDPVLEAGQEHYQAQCATCHGPAGGGGTGPGLSGVDERFPEIQDQIEIVRQGVEGTNMPAFGDTFDDDELEAVVRYTRESL